MLRSIRTRLVASMCASLLLAACGGGGGGGGSNGSSGGGNPNVTDPSVSIDTRTLSVTESSWDTGQQKTVVLTVQNMPAGGAWVAVDSTANGVAGADFVPVSASTSNLIIKFKPGTQNDLGTYNDTINVKVCGEQQCTTQFRNSPITITSTLVISGASTISPVASSVSVSADQKAASTSAPVGSTTVTIGSPGPVAPFIQLVSTSNLVTNLGAALETDTRLRLDATFKLPVGMTPGEYTENLQLEACYDMSCKRQLLGSPFAVRVIYKVTNNAQPEPGFQPVAFLSRQALSHDVIDSEYSKSMDALVMVSAYPRNSLYLYDMVSKVEREVVLGKVPKSVSVSPDGLRAAVGHDALISIVDLQQLRQTGAATPLLLNTTAIAFDIVLDGRGFVHVFPEVDQWVNVHSVEIATNTEGLSKGAQIYDSEHGRLDPSGNYIYAANNGLTPGDIEKFDVRGGIASYLYDSPYHGDYGMCGDLWIKDDGSTVYTRCGNTFRASTDKPQDMTYSGKLDLSTSPYYGFAIESLSQTSATREIALIEADTYLCDTRAQDPTGCYTHLAIYDSDLLNRVSVNTIDPVSVGGAWFAQRGQFVFHDSTGAHRYMISHLLGLPNHDNEYYLTILK